MPRERDPKTGRYIKTKPEAPNDAVVYMPEPVRLPWWKRWFR